MLAIRVSLQMGHNGPKYSLYTLVPLRRDFLVKAQSKWAGTPQCTSAISFRLVNPEQGIPPRAVQDYALPQ